MRHRGFSAGSPPRLDNVLADFYTPAATERGPLTSPKEVAVMTESLTDFLQRSRLIVVAIDPASGHLRVRGEAAACTDLQCHDQTIVVTDESAHAGLAALNPGDIVRVDTAAGRAQRIVVVRRVWEELTSPEF